VWWGFQTLEALSLYVSGRAEHYNIYTLTLWVWQDELGMTYPVNYTPRKLHLLWPQAFAICITLSYICVHIELENQSCVCFYKQQRERKQGDESLIVLCLNHRLVITRFVERHSCVTGTASAATYPSKNPQI
jgi:hypothetical protein